MKLIFLDTETTGLDLYRHEVWEVGAILREYRLANNGESLWANPEEDQEYRWFLPVNLRKADLIALNIGKFFERWPGIANVDQDITIPRTFCGQFMSLSKDAFLVGACVDFDAYRIARLMRRHKAIPAWNYHLVDVENLLAGKLKLPPPWKWRDTLETVGISMDKYEQHTALGDARLARDVYDWIMNASQD